MRKENLKILVVACFFIMTPGWQAAEGATIIVDDDAPAHFRRIQDAIDYAANGDEIQVRSGTYYEAVDFDGKEIRLYSIDGPEVTTIDGRLSYGDNFNDGDYTGWQIVDQGNYSTPSDWSAATGEMVQSSNIYTEPTSDERYLGTYALCTQDLPWADYEVTLSMKALDDDWMGVMFRYVDPNNYYRFAWNGTSLDRRLVKMENKTVTTLQQDNSTYVGDQWYNVRIAVRGDNLKVFVDDVKVFDVNDSSFSSGAIALYCWGNQGTYFDDIEVKWPAFHVVQCVSGEDANTILDGFTITGGDANGPTWPDDCGGGMYCDSSSPVVTNCTFSGNQADLGGGGMYNNNGSSPTLSNCTFTLNPAEYGGGMLNNNSSPTVSDCNFTGNTALDGGVMFNNNSSPTVSHCTFTLNSADYGGVMDNSYNSSPMVINCIFTGNSAAIQGGVLANDNSSPTVTNCTFTGNSAVTQGGVMINNSSSSPKVTNCILWSNTPDQIVDYDSPASTADVSYSNVEGGWPGILNFDQDPCFMDQASGDLRLSTSASSCVDTGTNSAPGLPATDMAGNPRIADGDKDGTAKVDRGAYEFQSGRIHNITQDHWYETIQLAIDAAAKGDEIEVSPGTYNEAIDFKGKAIRLYSTDGPNNTTIDANGLNSSVVTCDSSEDANTILEGFTITGGSGTTVGVYKFGGGMYNYSSSPTVTDCNFTTNSVTGDGGGMYNNVWSSPTVTNCSFAGNYAAYAGGGMDNRTDSSPTVVGCTFSQNTAGTDGGGMENYTRSNPTVINCLFTENTSKNSGGGLSNLHTSNPTITNCTFSGNSVSNGYGGGMNNYNNSIPTVSNCTFSSNTAAINGGGICNSTSSSSTMGNCTFTGNTASYYGGGMYNYSSSPTVTNCIFNHNIAQQASGGGIANYDGSHSIVTNCTFSGNTAGGGGGIRNWNSSPIVKNCILWDNEPDEISSAGTGTPVVNYSDIQDGYSGTGNINTDPNFVDANNPDPNLWNLRLLPDSACIDAADTTAVPSGIFVDLDENPRGVDDPQTPDTGISVMGATVDMGAYEFQICPIPGDINCDGVVDFKDVAILCGNWLAGTEPEL
ncbi:MAG: right-handed parallel beta-helix repeat-containing protein [Planctomycetota bacterium]|jgi:hypothetical protein